MVDSESTDEANLSASRRTKAGVFVVVALLHVLAVLALIRAFAPDFTNQVTERVVSAFAVTVTTPPPEPKPAPAAAQDAAGKSGAEGRKAKPKEVAAPRPRVEIAKAVAPATASTGNAVTSGARDSGNGTGAGGPGSGPGSGTGGSGQGGGSKAVKIAGDINSARDYPRESRDARINGHVVVAITVGTDGKPSACRVHRPSRDAEANAITCRLAMQRFRFRPATDSAGNPIVSTFGWKQTWFYRP